METQLKPGRLWFDNNVPLPSDWELAPKTLPGWRCLSTSVNRRNLHQNLAAVGWTFFFLSESISATAFGFSRSRMTEIALNRLVAAIALRKCNAFEIDTIGMRSLFGIPYIRISAHPRHLQQGALFSGA
jgi:hypothetical protein